MAKKYFSEEYFFSREVNNIMNKASFVDVCCEENEQCVNELLHTIIRGGVEGEQARNTLIEWSLPIVARTVIKEYPSGNSIMNPYELYMSGAYALTLLLYHLKKMPHQRYEVYASQNILKGMQKDLEAFSQPVSMSHYAHAKKLVNTNVYDAHNERDPCLRSVNRQHLIESPEVDFIRYENEELIEDAIRKILTRTERMVLNERLEGYSCKEIAQRHSKNFLTIKSHYKNALRKLRAQFV